MRNMDYLHQVPQLPQTQESLHDQLKELVWVANKLGLYDAADFLKERVHDSELDPIAERNADERYGSPEK